MEKILMYSDGGARGNPGPAGIGVVIEKCQKEDEDFETIKEISEYIGETTNNQAEYKAVMKGLEWIRDNLQEAGRVECRLDSELVVKQLNGEYRIKNNGLQEISLQVKQIIRDIGVRIDFIHVPRSKNIRADKLVNMAIDNK